jgi:glycosyltransferase involved in cell wall biosynthesis
VFVVAAGHNGGTRAAVSAYRSVVRRLLPGWPRLALRDIGRALQARAHSRRVAQAARKHKADIIIETQVHLTDSGSSAARECSLPFLLDDCSPPGEERTLGSGLSVLTRSMFARQVQAAAALTVSSHALRDRLVSEGVRPDKIVIVSNGVDFASFRASAGAEARVRWGIGAGPTLGFIGSFQPWHRVDLLIEAMTRVGPAAMPVLVLAGDGPGLNEALAAANRAGIADRVRALGSLPPAEIPAALSACDIGVLPGSNDYGQPMKLLEYAAAGLAIVAPDLPPVRAMLVDQITGVLFKPGDADALAAALRCLLQDESLRTRIGTEARNSIAATADWRQQGRELVAVAERLA